jgi:hypothetical protein
MSTEPMETEKETKILLHNRNQHTTLLAAEEVLHAIRRVTPLARVDGTPTQLDAINGIDAAIEVLQERQQMLILDLLTLRNGGWSS